MRAEELHEHEEMKRAMNALGWKLLSAGALVAAFLSGWIQWSHNDALGAVRQAQATIQRFEGQLSVITERTIRTDEAIQQARRSGKL